jgi:hypothetical protein
VSRRGAQRCCTVAACAVALAIGATSPVRAQVAPSDPSRTPSGLPTPGAPAEAAVRREGAPLGQAVPATALETWLTQPGRVVVERSRTLPPITLGGGVRLALEPLVAFEPVREHERALGVRVHLVGAGRAGRAALAYLDPFEIDDLTRTLAALPTLEQLQGPSRDAIAIRHLSRDGFGLFVSMSPGGSIRRAVRFPGDPPLDVDAPDSALAQLAHQLDAARAFLFDTPPER